jgi:hypothetical protein
LDTLWKEFEAQDYKGRITLFLETLDEQEPMDNEMAFEMLTTIYHESIDRDERTCFEELADKLSERQPDVYASDAHWYQVYRITNALATGKVDRLSGLVEEMTANSAIDIDLFNNVLDQLAYHGHLLVLVKGMRRAWPQIKGSGNIVPWGIDEFARRAAGYEIFYFLKRCPSPDLMDPMLVENLTYYFEIDPERLAHHIELLTGQVERRWTNDDFRFKPLDHSSYAVLGEEEEEIQELDDARKNLFDLSVEFLGYLQREERVPYTKGALASEQIPRYILERHAGELEPQENLFAVKRRSKRRKRKKRSARSVHPLCPDRSTLDRFLGGLLYFINPQRYKAAATLELVPAWLRFLESRRLVDEEQCAKTMLNLRGLDTSLLEVWRKYPDDPALQKGLEGWRDE